MGVLYREHGFIAIEQSLQVTEVSANTSAEQDFTVKGLKVGDIVFVNKPSLSAGLIVGNARVKAADTLSITFGNLTAQGIDPGAETYQIMVIRAEQKFATVEL